MLTNCFRFAPRDSVPGLIAKICKYLKDHPGWSEAELEEQIKQFIGQTGVESFNGRTGVVLLNEDDVNNLKIASAYFAEGDETIDELDLLALYNQGIRFVFTNWNEVTSGYDLSFVLDYFSGSNDVVYYPMATGSGGGGNIISVNGKTGIVELSLSDILGDSGAQVKLCTATEFTSTTLTTWNAYYEEGYRVVGVVNSDASAIDYIYLLKQDENNHQPIGLSVGASDAYTPANPPPYPVKSVNGRTGIVTGLYDAQNPPPYPVTSVNDVTGSVKIKTVDVVEGTEPDENVYIFVDESEENDENGGSDITSIVNLLYPVGAIYINTVDYCAPQSVLTGSEWARIEDVFLIGASDNYVSGSTGGEATHKLTADELPKVSGGLSIHGGETGTNYWQPQGVFSNSEVINQYASFNKTTSDAATSISRLNFDLGDDTPHNNMPPYMAVYMWKRTK